MLEIVGDFVEGDARDIFNQKDNLKAMYCTWDPKNKKWKIPYGVKLTTLEVFINTFNAQQTEKAKATWKQAVENCNLSFVKKGTEEYDLVREEFKRLMKI